MLRSLQMANETRAATRIQSLARQKAAKKRVEDLREKQRHATQERVESLERRILQLQGFVVDEEEEEDTEKKETTPLKSRGGSRRLRTPGATFITEAPSRQKSPPSRSKSKQGSRGSSRPSTMGKKKR